MFGGNGKRSSGGSVLSSGCHGKLAARLKRKTNENVPFLLIAAHCALRFEASEFLPVQFQLTRNLSLSLLFIDTRNIVSTRGSVFSLWRARVGEKALGRKAGYFPIAPRPIIRNDKNHTRNKQQNRETYTHIHAYICTHEMRDRERQGESEIGAF